MAGGRLRLELLAAGAVVGAFQLLDAVSSGTLDGGHGVCAYWFGKNKAFSLFGTAPPWFGDANQMLGWFYHGGGEALYKELLADVLKVNVVGFLTGPMPTQPLGWFKQPVERPEQFRGMKYRTVGLAADLFNEMGAAVTSLPGRRDRAGAGARRDRRGGVQQPLLRPRARLPRRRQGLHDPELPPAGGDASRSCSTRASTRPCRPSCRRFCDTARKRPRPT